MSVLWQKDGIYGFVVLNNPPVNAINCNIRQGLLDATDWAKSEGLERVILSGKGSCFAAGADAKEFDFAPVAPHLPDVLNCIESSTVPWIAALHGAVFGGGAELALACRYRVARSDASIGFPEVILGLVPGAGGTQRLSNIIGFSNSKYWILTAKKFSAIEAEKFGFLNFVVNKDNLLNYSINVAEEIIKNAPIAIKSAKLAINQGFQLNSLKEKLNIERKHYTTCLNSTDRLEALDAFNNKRKPKWENK